MARDLATVLSCGAWTRPALERRARTVLGAGAKESVHALVDEVIERAGTPYAPPPDRLARLILDCRVFERASMRARRLAAGQAPVLSSPRFWALPALRDVPVPKLTTVKDLADWLGLTLPDLEWLSDARRQHGRTETRALQHYTYAWVPKRSGALRLVEAPKARLKAAQRRILREILNPIPVHDAAHGFVRGRSCLTAAQRHGGERVVIGSIFARSS